MAKALSRLCVLSLLPSTASAGPFDFDIAVKAVLRNGVKAR